MPISAELLKTKREFKSVVENTTIQATAAAIDAL